jgi:hypothetical protein
MRYRVGIGAGLVVLLLALAARHGMPAAEPAPSYDQSAIARRGYFYVGGSYVGEPGKRAMHGQMHVEIDWLSHTVTER